MLIENPEPTKERELNPEIVLLTMQSELPLLSWVSNYTRLKRVTAWLFRFVNNCQSIEPSRGALTSMELLTAKNYWLGSAQRMAFPGEIMALKENRGIPSTSKLFSFHPQLDNQCLMRVGGRLGQAKLPYWKQQPASLPPNHKLTKLIIHSEHLRLLHAGPIFVAASLSRRFCIIEG